MMSKLSNANIERIENMIDADIEDARYEIRRAGNTDTWKARETRLNARKMYRTNLELSIRKAVKQS